MYDKCNMHSKNPNAEKHGIIPKSGLGYCWNCFPGNIPQKIDYTTNSDGELDIFRNEAADLAKYLGTTSNKILWIRESKEILQANQGMNTIYEKVKNNKNYYFEELGYRYIFTHDSELLDMDDRIKFTFGCGTWSSKEEDLKIHQKTKLISMFNSGKTMTKNHHYRNSIANKFKTELGSNLFGLFNNNKIDNKIDGLREYMFSIAIENEMDFLTEKLIDCFATGTVPIYHGPKLDLIYKQLGFHEEGIIRYTDNFKMADISEELYYEMMPYIEKNYLISLKYINPADYTFGIGGFIDNYL